jgi:hypothetical protein
VALFEQLCRSIAPHIGQRIDVCGEIRQILDFLADLDSAAGRIVEWNHFGGR